VPYEQLDAVAAGNGEGLFGHVPKARARRRRGAPRSLRRSGA
jgi:hypothetical protein